ncbi:MAG: C69 family dipeptidase [Bacteroidales bacterium]|jgi:dipeptidase|nr:C69 family dipeptidase [Bacteroidales bacterium]
MKKIFLFISAVIIVFFAFSQEELDYYEYESCTSIMVGKKASTDGSVITSHSCDGGYRTWMRIELSVEYKNDTTISIYKGVLKTETPTDGRGVSKTGEIFQPAMKTYAFLNTAYPCLNEKQLAIGETTFSGRPEMRNPDGLFYIEELQKIVLQRCKTAREAIKLIGELVKEYGYADGGECLTIADKNEVWQLEILGEGKERVGGVWAAQRIPDDHVGISANYSRIGVIDFNNKDFFMASDNVKEVAKELGYWDGIEEFKFYKAYNKEGYRPFAIRDYYILNSVAPSLQLKFDAEELPFSVQPDKKVSVRDVIALYRETYEGTEWDMTQNLLVEKVINDSISEMVKSGYANPWMTSDMIKMINSVDSRNITFQRTVAVAWCSYSFIVQLRDWLPDEVGGVAWFSLDNPGESPRFPIFCGTQQLPDLFNACGQYRFRTDAALWWYRRANRLATVKWQTIRKTIEENVRYFEDKAFEELPFLEQNVQQAVQKGEHKNATKLTTDYSNDFIRATLQKWWELGDMLWAVFGKSF